MYIINEHNTSTMYVHLVDTNLILVDTDDVSEKREKLDLNSDKVDVCLPIEVWSLSGFG